MKKIIAVLLLTLLMVNIIPSGVNAHEPAGYDIFESEDRLILINHQGVLYTWHLKQIIAFQYDTEPWGITLTQSYNTGHYTDHPQHPLFVMPGDLDVYEGSTRIRNWRFWDLEDYERILPVGVWPYGGRVIEDVYLHLLQASYHADAYVSTSYQGSGAVMHDITYNF